MIATWRDLSSFIGADFASMGHQRRLRALVVDPVARVVVLMRVLEYVSNAGAPAFVRLPVLFMFRRACIRLGFSLGPNIFGPGVAIVHYGLLVIDPTTRIGKNCRIHMGVHIGGAAKFVARGTESDYSPRIGDNVYIGPGAKIYGPVRIGNNCTIGANSVVTKSFADEGLTIAGVPAAVIATGGNGERVIRGAE